MQRFLLLLALAVGSQLAHPLDLAAQDWDVKRDPFDKDLIRRHKSQLAKSPHNQAALSKLFALYQRYRSVELLVREYEAELSKKETFSTLVVLGHIHRRDGKNDKALSAFERARALQAQDADVHLELGKLYLDAGRADEARTSLETALAASSAKSAKQEILRTLADLALKKSDIDGAKRYFESYIALDPKNHRARLELGDALAQHKKFDDAERVFREAEATLRGDPALRVEVIARIGSALEGMGRDLEAVKEYQRGIKLVGRGYYIRKELTARIIEVYRRRQQLEDLTKELDKSWPSARRDHFEWDVMARLFEETGLADKAIDAYKKATQKAPHELETQRRLIVLLENSGLEDAALARYEEVIRVAPGEPRFALELAERYWKRGDTQKALALAKRIESRFAGDAGVVSALADLYSSWQKLDLALAGYERLTRIEPGDNRHIENLGEQVFQRGDKKKATAIWSKILRVKSADTYSQLARIYAEHDMLVESLDMYGKAIRLAPKDAALFKGRGNVHERLRRFGEAITDWEQALGLTPDKKANQAERREARKRVVHLLQREGRNKLQERIRAWQTSFSQTPADLGAGYYLVEAYLRVNDFENAKKTLQGILALRPEDIDAMEALVKVYRANPADRDRAVDLLLKLLTLSPGRERDIYNQIAEIRTEQKRDGEAIEYVKRALDKTPNDPVAYQRLAERYTDMLQHKLAIEAYEKVVELSPRNFAVYFTLASLYRLQVDPAYRRKAAALYHTILAEATDEETLHKAGQRAIEDEWIDGTLGELERVVAPMVATQAHKPIYRRILVQLYGHYVPQLLERRARGKKEAAAADKELRHLGSHGLRPLLEALNDKKDVAQQRIAVDVLGYLGNPAAAAPLVRIAGNEPSEDSQRMGTLVPTLDWEVRVKALIAAGRLGDPRTVPDLIALTGHKEVAMREAAVFALAPTKDRKAKEALLAATRDPRHSVQTLACIGLAQHGDAKSIEAALTLLRSGESHDRTRAACAWMLGTTRTPLALQPLIDTLEEGNDEAQRGAAWALGELGDRKAVPALMRAYFSKRLEVRGQVAAALSSLARGRAPSQRELRMSDYPMSSGKFDDLLALKALIPPPSADSISAEVLIGQDEHAVAGVRLSLSRHRDLVLRALTDLDSRREGVGLGLLTDSAGLLKGSQRQALDASLAIVGQSLLPDLVTLSQHADAEVRRRVVSIMSKIGGDLARTHVLAALSDDKPLVREAGMFAAAALAHLHPSPHDGELAAQVEERLRAKAWRERASAAKALGRLGKTAPHAGLVAALGTDKKGLVREAAARALGERGEATQVVLEALAGASDHRKESREYVRIAALRALQAIGGETALSICRRVAKVDPSKAVQAAAGQN